MAFTVLSGGISKEKSGGKEEISYEGADDLFYTEIVISEMVEALNVG